MDELQHYPTPRALAKYAWSKFKNKDLRRVLEPQAGDGSLADAQHEPEYRYIYGARKAKVDVCEIDIRHHPTLREKGYDVVGLDFLSFNGPSIYDAIILNPPFSAGAEHVLKAWDLLWDGELVAILNAETIRNPFSAKRRLLVDIIEEHGEVEFLQDQFRGAGVEREADVEIALVYLPKKADVSNDIVGSLLAELRADAETGAGLSGGYHEPHELMLPNTEIENHVLAFKAAVKSMQAAVFAQAKADYYEALLGDTMVVRNGSAAGENKRDSAVEWVRGEIEDRYSKLKDRAWAQILHSTAVTRRLGSKAARRVESEFETIKRLEFSSMNIHGFLCGLVENQGALQIEAACDVFDTITKYVPGNRAYYMGWKSNARHKTCGMRIKTTRFILPGYKTESYQSQCYEAVRVLADFDKVFARLDGKEGAYFGMAAAFNNYFDRLRQGERVETTYFDVRYFPGRGTIHVFPRSPKLVDRLNRFVGRHRAWLPPETTPMSDDFWKQFDMAEKFEKALHTEINGGAYAWRDPFHVFASSHDEAEAQRAAGKIGDALGTILERHGIHVDGLLTASQQDEAFLLESPKAA